MLHHSCISVSFSVAKGCSRECQHSVQPTSEGKIIYVGIFAIHSLQISRHFQVLQCLLHMPQARSTLDTVILYIRARSAHPEKGVYYSALPPFSQGLSQYNMGFAQSFAQPSDSVLLWPLHAFCANFHGAKPAHSCLQTCPKFSQP